MNLKKMPKLSERLKYIRAHFDLSQAELADKAGTTQQAIQQAETGKARQPRYLNKLAQELELPIDWVIFGEVENSEIPTPVDRKGFNDQSLNVLNQFYSMPKEDQKLIYELMKSRQKIDSKK